MGMTRKSLSLLTFGLVDFRSDKERTAAYTAGIRKQVRKQTKIMQRAEATPLQAWKRPDREHVAARDVQVGWTIYRLGQGFVVLSVLKTGQQSVQVITTGPTLRLRSSDLVQVSV